MTQKIKLKDYSAPAFSTEAVHFDFVIQKNETIVRSEFLAIKKQTSNELFLHGENLELVEVKVDGKVLSKDAYEKTDLGLTIQIKQDISKIEIENIIYPDQNTALEGLYRSGTILSTQNEPEGFRKIAYFFDRSDVLCKYTTSITANKKDYPYLLANGNLLSSEDLDGDLHRIVWEDPFKKPTYLFALVAGDLAKVTDTFKTCSGKNVALEFFVDFGNEDKCEHAIRSLQNAMKWDEEVFGLEYDLDIYMVVAVDSFNMGAMENKGLNIFNSSCVLARPDMATDYDFRRIEGIVAHEYFHNWTGNRVTLRNWFELTLKEGLTVFRDQEFSSDMLDRTVQRLQDVKDLKRAQFAEDAGPMSHPIRPKEYEEINNFYTATVYNKGAEVIRMIHTIIGAANFRLGMDLYFKRFDGKAVTTEDFVQAMSDASGADFSLFKNWYDESGTPRVKVDSSYDEGQKRLTVKLVQQSRERVLHIPLGIGLVTKDGELPIKHGEVENGIFHFKQKEAELIFDDIEVLPILSINRNFSAPVYIDQELSLTDYQTLAAFDGDLFNRAEAFKNLMKKNIDIIRTTQEQVLFEEVKNVIARNLDQNISESYLAEFFEIPSEAELNQELTIADYHGVHQARDQFMNLIGTQFKKELNQKIISLNQNYGEFKIDSKSMGQRALKNRLLGILSRTECSEVLDTIIQANENASNMTDELASLVMLGSFSSTIVDDVREKFINKWKDESLVVDKWLSALASIQVGDTLKVVKELEQHPLYDHKNPNKFRSLVGSFAANYTHFHKEDGSGYRFMSDKIIEMDEINPQIAARVLTSFSQVKRLPDNLKKMMNDELSRILENAKSKDVAEVARKYLS